MVIYKVSAVFLGENVADLIEICLYYRLEKAHHSISIENRRYITAADLRHVAVHLHEAGHAPPPFLQVWHKC